MVKKDIEEDIPAELLADNTVDEAADIPDELLVQDIPSELLVEQPKAIKTEPVNITEQKWKQYKAPPLTKEQMQAKLEKYKLPSERTPEERARMKETPGGFFRRQLETFKTLPTYSAPASIAQDVIGEGMEIATSPLTYIPIPAGAAIKGGLSYLAKKELPLLTPVAKTLLKPIFKETVAKTKQVVATPIFDEIKSKIQYEAPKAEKVPLKERITDTFDFLKTQLTNKYAAIDKYTEIAKKISPVADESNPVYLYNKFAGSKGIADAFVNYDLKPIIKPIENQIDDFNGYLVSKRLLELYETKPNVMKKLGTTPDKIMEGMTQLENKVGKKTMALFEKQSQDLSKYNSKLLTMLKESGMISPELETKLLEFKDYTPLQRVLDDIDTTAGIGKRKDVFSVKYQDVVKRLEGSEKDIVNPIESIIKNTYKTIFLTNRNNVARSVVDLAKAGGDLANTIVKVKPKMFPINYIDKEGLKETLFRPSSLTPTPDSIAVFEGGKKHFYQVPKDLHGAMTQLNQGQMDTIVKIMSIPSKIVRAGATMYNPEFFFPNVLRDQWTAYINSKYGYIPGYDFIAGLSHMVKKDAMYQKFLKSGADQSVLVASDRSAMQRTFKDLLDKRSINFVTEAAKHPIKTLQSISAFSELPTRIGVFQRALKKGATELEAGVEAREATVNFQRIGQAMRAPNALVAFLNARLQGSLKLTKTIKQRPLQTAMRMSPIIAATGALYAYNKTFENYNNLPKYIRDNYWVFMLNDKDYVKIPKGEIGKIGANPLEHYLNYLEKNGDNETIASILSQPLFEFSPVQSAGDIIPNAIKPMVENQANYSYFKNQYLVSPYQKNLPKPAQTSYSTSEISRKAGALTGQSPAMIENLIGGYAPGVPMNVMRGISWMMKPDNKESIPILRRFLGEYTPEMEQYKNIKDISKTKQLKQAVGVLKGKKDLTEEEKNMYMRQLLEINRKNIKR